MIIFEKGRVRSVKKKTDDVDALKKEFENLSPEEQRVAEIILAEIDEEKTELLDAFTELEYRVKPVSIEEFLNTDYFLGKSVKRIFPKLKDDLIELFSNDYYLAVITGAIGTGKCVTGDTEVYNIDDGKRYTVKELFEKGVRFITASFDERNNLIRKEVKAVGYSGKKKICRLVLDNGMSIRLSIDHKVLTSNGWVEAGLLKKGDFAATPRFLPEPNNVLNVSDEEVKIVAYLLADGSCSSGNFDFTNENEKILNEVKDCVEKLPVDEWRGGRYRTVDNRDLSERVKFKGSAGKAKTYHICRLRWLGKKYGLTKKSIEKRVPPEFYALSDRQLGLFLNRFIACDGHIGVMRRCIEIGLASEKLIDDLQILLLRFGVFSRKSEKINGKFKSWRLTVAGKNNIKKFFDKVGLIFGKEEDCRRLILNNELVKGNSNVDIVPIDYEGLKRIRSAVGGMSTEVWKKYRYFGTQLMGRDKFEKIREEYGDKIGEFLSYGNDVFWAKVKTVEMQGFEDVYDVEVPDAHNFVANGIVVHNTTFAEIGLIRLLYELSCLKNPQATLGLMDDSIISLANISVTQKLARKVIFGPIVNMLKESPYFTHDFSFEYTQSELRFPNNIWVAPLSSSDTSILGLNTFGAIMDEGNFMDVVSRQQYAALRKTHKLYTHADALFDAIIRRMKSRYMQKGGQVSGKLFILSSKRTQNDFIYRLLREYKDDEGIFVRDYALWDTRPSIFVGEDKFKVLVGNEIVQSRIIDDEEAKKYEGREDIFVIEVPNVFKKDFERSIDDALRDIAGIATIAITPFFTNRQKIYESVDQQRTHPFEYEVWESISPMKFHWDKMIKTYENGETRPIVNPDAARFVHIDIGIRRDCAGFAMGHIYGYKEVERRGKVERLPIIYIDFMLRVSPPPGGEILLSDLRQMVYELSGHGFHIGYVSFDSYQSTDSIQQLRGMGYDTGIISMDSSTVPYENLKDVIYEGRLIMYPYEIALKELRELEVNQMKRKIDHPEYGCFTGDTKVSLVDGRELSFVELVKEYGNGEPFYVYSLSEDRQIKIGVARNPRLTKRNAKLLKITLDNGEVIKCTEDHRFCVNYGGWGYRKKIKYVEAKDLKVNQRLTALYRKKSDFLNPKGYEMVRNPGTGRFVFTHRIACEGYKGGCGLVVHHKNFDKKDNRPNNLIALSKQEHDAYHSKIGKEHVITDEMKKKRRQAALVNWKDDDYRKKVIEGIKKRWENDEALRLKQAENSRRLFTKEKQEKMRAGWERHTKENIEKHREWTLNFYNSPAGEEWKRRQRERRLRKDVTIDKLLELAEQGVSHVEFRKKLGCGCGVIYRVLRENGYSGLSEFLKTVNHRIVKIEDGGFGDVYDITVEKYHNFALSAGVFVHNSKDVADAICGVVYAASTRTPNETFVPETGVSEMPGSQYTVLDNDPFKMMEEQESEGIVFPV